MKKRHNLPLANVAPVNSVIEKEQVSVTQKEETVRKAGMQ